MKALFGNTKIAINVKQLPYVAQKLLNYTAVLFKQFVHTDNMTDARTAAQCAQKWRPVYPQNDEIYREIAK